VSDSFDAIVLAGGRSSRMASADLGRDKTRLEVGGVALLDRVLAALPDAATVVVVGQQRPVVRDVVWTREDPPGTGPAAAIAAGLSHVTASRVVLLAGDLPFATAGLVHRLLDAVRDGGVVVVDAAGHEQWLVSAWQVAALRTAELAPGASLRSALAPLQPTRLVLGRDEDAVSLDCDTPEDLQRARELM